jgi:spermidine synthase
MNIDLNRSPRPYFALFWLSGFAGLIYESVWTQYIKLFLGHAAYAQTLVLSIFMGGLALGSWLASRHSIGWKNLLVTYAIVEGVIGVAALLFHKSFIVTTDFAYDRLLPEVGTAAVAHGIKWGLGAAFILPQSILLGMTFPLMSGGIIRRFPGNPGASLAVLYFSNSFGAALGVLASGFFLIARTGLPGTILTAGLINLFVALFAWLLSRDHVETVIQRPTELFPSSGKLSAYGIGILGAAFVTGAASFLYEIAWIRGLSMVLGSSTHSFELMLSAFILGLAFGGLWIRRRIDSLSSPEKFLGHLQLAMGLLALATLPLFATVFDAMEYVVQAIARTQQGYNLYQLCLHALCLLVMLPTTFCAGMTLPLMTYLLLRRGEGERAIGAVYAANTLGAIAGVLLAVHVVMPWVGVKGVIWAGAALDLGLGVLLLRIHLRGHALRRLAVPALAAVGALSLAAVFFQLDPRQLLSSVYRFGSARLADDQQVIFLKDGKTATIGLVKTPEGMVAISTNGKTDAALFMAGDESSDDDATMILAGALGLVLHPDATIAANIGFGSGLTTHVMLASPKLERVDTVEIEPYMVEAARVYGPRVERAFADRRSHIHIEDAKTFFSTRRQRYDLIVSEPSNPWVSGVSSLFSQEFYARIGGYLQSNGLFVQWIQMYEIDIDVIASILKALSAHFSDYVMYTSDDANLLIVARKDGPVGQLHADVLTQPALAAELRRIGIASVDDFQVRRIGSKRSFDPLFQSINAPANSDYFPFVDQTAERSRFLKSNTVTPLFGLTTQPLPLLEMLDSTVHTEPLGLNLLSKWPIRTKRVGDARALRQALLENRYGDVPRSIRPTALLPQLLLQACDEANTREAWIDALIDLASATVPYLTPGELEPMWRKLEAQRCFARLSEPQRDWLGLARAIGRRDAPMMAALSRRVLERPETGGNLVRTRYAVMSGMLGHIVSAQTGQAWLLWEQFGSQVIPIQAPPLEGRLLLSLARAGTREAHLFQRALDSRP